MTRWTLPLMAVLLLSGCGSTAPAPVAKINHLSGAEVGSMAERQLEMQHPGMAVGTVTCPDLVWRLHAMVRCIQTAVLSDGRQLRIPGSVTVTSLAGGGSLHVLLDQQVDQFGVTGDRLSTEVSSWVQRRVRSRPVSVLCPYLPGTPGTVVRCAVRVAARQSRVLVTVTGVRPTDYVTRYTLSWPELRKSPKLRAAFVAIHPGAVVD